jgi:hypothetical protein
VDVSLPWLRRDWLIRAFVDYCPRILHAGHELLTKALQGIERIQIVPSGALLGTNFTYYLHEDDQTALRFAFWLALAVGVGLIVGRRPRKMPSPSAMNNS